MNTHAINDGEWKLLLDQKSEGCVSIFMPTYRPKGDARQDAVRLKNLLREAREALTARGLEAERATAVLKPVYALFDDVDFWKHPKNGLAVFGSPDFCRAYPLPYEVRERVVAGERLYLRPLMPLCQLRGRFYVLALSLKDVRLLEASWLDFKRIDLDGVPRSFEEMGYEEYYAVKKQSHGGGSRGMAVPGHGDHDQDKIEQDVLHFFQEVAKALDKKIPDSKAPLVLATVKDNVALFRAGSKHPNILEEAIVGNPDDLPDHELHERAWALVEPYFLEQRATALERYGDLKASGKTSSKVEDVVPAAHAGRVETLFLSPEGPEVWGSYDTTAAAVSIATDGPSHGGPPHGGGSHREELIDQAASLTLKQGGMVYSLPPEEIPDGGPTAAVFRY